MQCSLWAKGKWPPWRIDYGWCTLVQIFMILQVALAGFLGADFFG